MREPDHPRLPPPRARAATTAGCRPASTSTATSRSSRPARRRTRRSTSGPSRSTARSTSRCAGPGTSCSALPAETFRCDIHCVTKWSKLDTELGGRLARHAARGRRDRRRTTSPRCATAATRRTCRSRTSPTARRGSPTSTTATPLEPEHGGPARLLVPHLYFWKSAKWVRGLSCADDDEPGFWESARLPQPRRPVARAALLGRLTGRRRCAGRSRGSRGARRDAARAHARRSTCPTGPGHRAGQHVDVRLTAEDGYRAQRSYSIASAPEAAMLEITVERLDDGEVSP